MALKPWEWMRLSRESMWSNNEVFDNTIVLESWTMETENG